MRGCGRGAFLPASAVNVRRTLHYFNMNDRKKKMVNV